MSDRIPDSEELIQISTVEIDGVWYATETGAQITGLGSDELQAAINYLEFLRDSR